MNCLQSKVRHIPTSNLNRSMRKESLALRNFLTALVALILPALFFCTPAQANDINPEQENYTAPEASGPIVLDGDLSEWAAPAVENPTFVPNGGGDLISFEPFGGGTWDGAADFTVESVQVTWYEDSIYLGVVVTDEYHEHGAGGGGSTWNGDAIQLMVANEARDAQVAGGGLHNYALLGTDAVPSDEVSVHDEGSLLAARRPSSVMLTQGPLPTRSACRLQRLASTRWRKG
jgi:hypothetical protein